MKDIQEFVVPWIWHCRARNSFLLEGWGLVLYDLGHRLGYQFGLQISVLQAVEEKEVRVTLEEFSE